MGWEHRGSSKHRYYTRSYRIKGVVKREYVGCGEHAETAARIDEVERDARLEQRRSRREFKERIAAQLVEWRRADSDVERLTTVLLESYGIKYHRGDWRKARMQTSSESVWTIVAKGNSGDPEALARVSAELAGESRKELIEKAGDLVRQVEIASLRVLGKNQEAMKMIIEERLIELRNELSPGNPIEKLIVDRIALTYLQLHLAEMLLYQSKEQSREAIHRIETLNRAYLKGLKTLSDIRRKRVSFSVETS